MAREHEELVGAAERGDSDELVRLTHLHLHAGYSETTATPLAR